MELKPTIFEFTSYKVEPDKKKIFFNYTVKFKNTPDISFTETIILPKAPDFKRIPEELFNKILQNLHLALGVSYYKLHCATKFKVNYLLSEEEADFWNVFYKKGLGEFLFRNKLDPQIVPDFAFRKGKKSQPFRVERNRRFLVGVGGGKDSIVSVELLKKYGADFSLIYTET
ncbi:MAG: hypothetical protein NT026_00045, partial [Candidatus Staskawiczbacteria bacterium]|nr:hypothetical protein [Candidatus Staskawiczbacteria bacterium]